MKHLTLTILGNMLAVGAALAQTGNPHPAPVIKIARPLKTVGSPEIVTGVIKPGAVFFRQKLAYVRTGVLKTAMTLTGKDASEELPAGTPVFGFDAEYAYQGPVIWCTLPRKDKPEICLMHNSGKPIWAVEQEDVTFNGNSFMSMTPDPAPEPEVDETAPAPDTDFSVEFALGDPNEVEKPIPLKNGKGFIVVSEPKAGMVIAFRYLSHGESVESGKYSFHQPTDVIVGGEAGARLSYDAVAGAFTASEN